MIVRELAELLSLRNGFRQKGQKVVMTNGCFDIVHAGHVDYLNKARSEGDILIVAINTDASVRRIKGEKRPLVEENQRAFVLSNLRSVDIVTFFDENTPAEIIDAVLPDVLVKGADWAIENIVGRETVESHGGKVVRIEFVNDQSTSKIINKILSVYK
ncbi:MAG: D-glycero-beta-D-manno-heptose 1-phosphate adenylyltransferase [Ignavibacteriales bacterium]|nr:D-glycero-beta-D-manno-heptose 1-phosphate adenylyltransferase [Ignavibacteriales bacterium]MCF8314866.1 D-glycero-beta-D-manno-heptose 1-phosphate adenylyltransferase [Ignavibacteriales bacterium]MCF8436185.1 D-glycero-beta-D-manno-heptose 1-phosphate adenylyltransferase [Ignavibacteriales bacterium]